MNTRQDYISLKPKSVLLVLLIVENLSHSPHKLMRLNSHGRQITDSEESKDPDKIRLRDS